MKVHPIKLLMLTVSLSTQEHDGADILLQLAQNSDLTLTDSRFAHPRKPKQSSDVVTSLNTVHPMSMTSSQSEIVNKMKENEEVRNFQENVLAKFKANVKVSQDTSPMQNSPTHTAEEVVELAPEASPTIAVTCATDSETENLAKNDNESHDSDEEKDTEDEDRENLTHFKTWGTPPKREKPRSRVRKVILTGLPASTDLTLVQSLISGGAIDTYTLSPIGHTAYVTFASGDACDKFYEKHPNGIDFKHEGKSYTSFVDRSKDVDVISGMLQGYLDCGATRCVRAVNVDEDWGMRALHRVAEGQKKSRKVEKIIDSFRNGVRTVVFRFTSVSDAVAFRGGLLRGVDWEGVRVEFDKDPCELATGVHME